MHKNQITFNGDELLPLLVPTLNLNGNTKASLTEPLGALIMALSSVSTGFEQASDLCHGRNFPAAAIGLSLNKAREAREAFSQRVTIVRQIKRELEELWGAIDGQQR